MINVKVNIKIKRNAEFGTHIRNSAGVQAFTYNVARSVMANAKAHFLKMKVHPDVTRTKNYVSSLSVHKLDKGAWAVGSSDPLAVMIEFGTHPGGGDTETLGYAPLRTGLDAQRATRR